VLKERLELFSDEKVFQKLPLPQHLQGEYDPNNPPRPELPAEPSEIIPYPQIFP
jgi:hypothetical protein